MRYIKASHRVSRLLSVIALQVIETGRLWSRSHRAHNEVHVVHSNRIVWSVVYPHLSCSTGSCCWRISRRWDAANSHSQSSSSASFMCSHGFHPHAQRRGACKVCLGCSDSLTWFSCFTIVSWLSKALEVIYSVLSSQIRSLDMTYMQLQDVVARSSLQSFFRVRNKSGYIGEAHYIAQVCAGK